MISPNHRFFQTLFSRFLVFHGGSGSTKEEIKTAVGNGVVKMNVDTGTFFTRLLSLLAYLGCRYPMGISPRDQGT